MDELPTFCRLLSPSDMESPAPSHSITPESMRLADQALFMTYNTSSASILTEHSTSGADSQCQKPSAERKSYSWSPESQRQTVMEEWIPPSISDLVAQFRVLNYEIIQFSANAAFSSTFDRLKASPASSHTTQLVRSLLGDALYGILLRRSADLEAPKSTLQFCLQTTLVVVCTQTIDCESGAFHADPLDWRKDGQSTLGHLVEAITCLLCVARCTNTNTLIMEQASRLAIIVRVTLALKCALKKWMDIRPGFVESGAEYEDATMEAISLSSQRRDNGMVLCTVGLGIYQELPPSGEPDGDRSTTLYSILPAEVILEVP